MENASPTRTIRFTDLDDLNRFVFGLPETLAEPLWRRGAYQCPARKRAFPLDKLLSLSVPLARDLLDAARTNLKTGTCIRVVLRTEGRGPISLALWNNPVAEFLVQLTMQEKRGRSW